MNGARIADSTRGDEAAVVLAEGERHVGALLERATSFRILFLRLPRPPKWLAALMGCAAGGYLDRGDRLRGCGIGATGSTLALPTK